MSIDPFSGRNPSYCFVELATKAQAAQAMEYLSGQNVLGRPVKLGPGLASSRRRQPGLEAFRRDTRLDAKDHFQAYSEQGRRVWVGGLPKMGSHAAVNQGVRELFAGFEMCVRTFHLNLVARRMY